MSGKIVGALLATVTGVLTASATLTPAFQEQQRKREEEKLKAQANSPPVASPSEPAQQTPTPVNNAQMRLSEEKDIKPASPKPMSSNWSMLGGWAWKSNDKEQCSDPPKATSPANPQGREA